MRTTRTTRAAQVTARETQKVWLIRQRRSPVPSWCESCGAEAQMLAPEEAAAFSRTDLQAVNYSIERGKLHGKTTTEGSVLVCLNSLLTKSDGEDPGNEPAAATE